MCVALTDRIGVGYLNMQTTAAGGAISTFVERVETWGSPDIPVFRQAAIGMTLDDLIERYGLPAPHHIKIDVDGLEDKIVAGGQRTLQDRRVRSVLLELDRRREGHRAVMERMAAWGYVVIERGGGDNHVFERQSA